MPAPLTGPTAPDPGSPRLNPDLGTPPKSPGPTLSRRRLLTLGAAGLAVAGLGVGGFELTRRPAAPSLQAIGPRSPLVAATEATRSTTGKIVSQTLTAAPTTVDLGGRVVDTWAYNGSVGTPLIRVTAGDRLDVHLVNQLTDPTTVHWHGLALRNDMDGVPGVTMDPVAPAADFQYSFTAPHPGTYWFHPHVGVQMDRGLQGALIIDDPHEPGGYDQEAVLILDDWTDGWSDTPDAILARLGRDGMSMGGSGGMSMGSGSMGSGGMNMGGASSSSSPGSMGGMDMGSSVSAAHPIGTDTGDVVYPAHLINGRLPQDPAVVSASPGQRIRFRLINAGSDTAYRFAVGGHRLTVTHADGYPVQPVEVDTVLLGMGERYDVVVTAGDGAFPIVASPEGKDNPAAQAVLRTASGPAPAVGARPVELGGRLLTYTDLVPTAAAALSARQPDRQLDLALGMVNGGRQWVLNGVPYDQHQALDVTAGQRVRITMRNQTMMFHPMHLHGHTFAVVTGTGDTTAPGVRKDTVNVLPMQTLAIDLDTDNPGQWLAHCHNAYHGELGMMTVMSYTV
jgi:FtsP/CotA-like multicopper oxidase with cupredoxin domain